MKFFGKTLGKILNKKYIVFLVAIVLVICLWAYTNYAIEGYNATATLDKSLDELKTDINKDINTKKNELGSLEGRLVTVDGNKDAGIIKLVKPGSKLSIKTDRNIISWLLEKTQFTNDSKFKPLVAKRDQIQDVILTVGIRDVPGTTGANKPTEHFVSETEERKTVLPSDPKPSWLTAGGNSLKGRVLGLKYFRFGTKEVKKNGIIEKQDLPTFLTSCTKGCGIIYDTFPDNDINYAHIINNNPKCNYLDYLQACTVNEQRNSCLKVIGVDADKNFKNLDNINRVKVYSDLKTIITGITFSSTINSFTPFLFVSYNEANLTPDEQKLLSDFVTLNESFLRKAIYG
jgi:hypothetical protein